MCVCVPTCQQQPLRLVDVEGQVGVFVMMTLILLHRPGHTNVPHLDLNMGERPQPVSGSSQYVATVALKVYFG